MEEEILTEEPELTLISLDQEDFYRFRGAWIANERDRGNATNDGITLPKDPVVIVKTRDGSGYFNSDDKWEEFDRSPQRSNVQYIADQPSPYDNTYTLYYFSVLPADYELANHLLRCRVWDGMDAVLVPDPHLRSLWSSRIKNAPS